MNEQASILSRLDEVIRQRKATPSGRSYTSQLLQAGVDAIREKIREEAEELSDAAARAAPSDVVHETADLVYHVLVLLRCFDLGLSDVETELSRRFGVSGLEEKRRRGET